MANDHIADDRKKVRLVDANLLMQWVEKLEAYNMGRIGCQKKPKGVTPEGVRRLIDTMPKVDAVEVDDMREFAKDVAYQFGYYCQNGGRLHITHGGLSTLEEAFDILGWENPHPVPECECEIDGCHEHATCGAPTADGYKRMCSKHCLERRN